MHPLSGHTIVILPGIDGTLISFEPFRRVLPPDVTAQVIAYPPDTLLSFEETVQYARERIAPDSKMLLLAESFSGPVAVALVALGCLQAECLILVSTFARSPRPVVLKLLRCLPLESILELPLPRSLMNLVLAEGENITDIFLNLAKEVRAVLPAKTLAHRLEVVDHVDVRALLPNITIPCLYLQASSDKTVPAACLHDFTEALPDLRVKRIRGPHFIIQAKPRECLEAIEQFVVSAGLCK